MGRNFRVSNRAVEKSLRNLSQERLIGQRQEKILNRLEHTEKSALKEIETETYFLREQLVSYGRGMTRLSSYFQKEPTDGNKNTIWFPLQRTPADWEPRPCWLGKASLNEARCTHFPCRNITSYHFIFRDLPRWIMKEAEISVRKSKSSDFRTERYEDENGNGKTTISQENEKIASKLAISRGKGILAPKSRKSWQTTMDINLPPINFPEGITHKERKLKITIAKKRAQNELENKPQDRSVNYGKPSSVRRLQRPVRPVVRTVDIR